MATVEIRLSNEQEAALQGLSKRLNVPADVLAAAAVRDLLTLAESEVIRIARDVVEENKELYDRLR